MGQLWTVYMMLPFPFPMTMVMELVNSIAGLH
jgi:hypothetical protein